MFKKWKLRKYQKIFFIDSENVGYQLPDEIPENIYIYLFVSNPFVLDKLGDDITKYKKQLEIVDIRPLMKHGATKNAMDFCIVAKLAEIMLWVSFHQKMIIVSRDKGYDISIAFMKQQYPRKSIERYSLPMTCYYASHDCTQKIINQLDHDVMKLVTSHQTMAGLKRFLTKNQKSLFVIEEFTEEISGIKVFIEYDIYLNQYDLYYSGNIKQRYYHLEEAQQDFHDLVNMLQKKYQKYYSKELLFKAKELHIHQYIEEAYLKKQTLQDCLISHFGQKEGIYLFNQFIQA